MAADPKAKLEEMLHNLGFEATVEEIDQPDGRVLNIVTEEDSGRLIGRRGQTLIDLQYLLNRMVYNEDKEAAKVLVDVSGYRFSARQSIVDQAKKAAEKVRRWGDIVELEPMNAFDRRMVHNLLKDDPDVDTHSVEVDGTSDKAMILRPKR